MATKRKPAPKMTVLAEKVGEPITEKYLDPPAGTIAVAPKPVPSPNIDGTTDLIVLASRGELDVDKLRILIDMKNAQADREARNAWTAAMCECQSKMPTIHRSKKGSKSNYAPYEELDRIIRPIYTAAGFSLSFGEEPTKSTESHMWMYCDCAHRAGHIVRFEGQYPRDGKGSQGNQIAMTALQAVGSGKSYAKRYIAKDIFALAESDEDNDGANDEQKPTGDQIKEINTLITKRMQYEIPHPFSFEKFIKWAGVESLDELDQRGVNNCIMELLRQTRECHAAYIKSQPKEGTP